jgi:hypothetical protein
MLTADQLIDTYVADVTRLLPSRQRADVALELRTLLADEIADRPGSALDVLQDFGRPDEVAARYGTPVSVIEPVHTRLFLKFAVVGSLFFLYAGLMRVLSGQSGSGTAIAVFVYLGVLLVIFAIAGWQRRRWPSTAAWQPHPRTERFSRTGRVAAIVAWTAGTVVLFASGRIFPAQVFTFTDDFARLRGPVLLSWILVALGLQVILVMQGGWRPWSRTAELVLNALMCVLFAWVVTRPIFTAGPTDEAMRNAMVLIAAVTIVSVASRVWHRTV